MSRSPRPVPSLEQWQQATNAFAAGDWSGCLHALKPLISYFGLAPSWVQLAARAHVQSRNFRPALDLLLQGLNEQPRCGKLWEFAAAVWLMTDHWDVARACLQQVESQGLSRHEAPAIRQRLQACPAGGPAAPASWQRRLADLASPPSVGVCMIVRNEEAFLADSLASVQGLDDLVVIDTGSTDATVSIAERMGARIGRLAWGDDFAAARNAALAISQTDWVLVLDADERVVGGTDAIRRSIDDLGGGRQILAPVIANAGQAGGEPSYHRVGRLFARKPGRCYQGRIHEQLVDAEGMPLISCSVDGWHIDHDGYRPEIMQQRDKTARNTALLARWIAESPDDGDAYYYLASEHMAAGRVELALPLFQQAAMVRLPGQFQALNHLGRMQCHAQLGDWSSVLRLGNEQPLERFPDYWLLVAQARRHGGQLRSALMACEKALSLPPDHTATVESAGARTWQAQQLRTTLLQLLATTPGDTPKPDRDSGR